MLRPPLQELGRSASFVRPPVALRVLETSTCQSSAGEVMWVVGSRRFSLQDLQNMEFSRPLLGLESRHAEASALRAWLFWPRGLRSPEHEETVRPEVKVSLYGAETASSTQSTAWLVQCWSCCRPDSPQGSPTPPWRFMWRQPGLPHLSWWAFSG